MSEKCVICGKEATGHYDGWPVCCECYDSGRLADWLKERGRDENTKVSKKSE